MDRDLKNNKAMSNIEKSLLIGIAIGAIVATLLFNCWRYFIVRFNDATLNGGWGISNEYIRENDDWQIRSFDFHKDGPFDFWGPDTVDIELRNGEKITLTYDIENPLDYFKRKIIIHDFPGIGDIAFAYSTRPKLYIFGDSPPTGEYFFAG